MKIEIPAGSPFFAGHFPGHPILPGIAHLALAFGSRPLSEVRTLKLRRPVLPGDVLDLSLEETDDLSRFELRRDGEVVSNGTVRIGGGEAAVAEVPLPASPSPSPGELIPHAPPALLVRTASVAVIPEDNPFVAAGRAPAFVGLEAGAQTAAFLEALGRSSGEPRIGYVVAIRNARFRTAWLPAGRPLPVTVKPAGSAPPLSIYEVSVGEVVTGLVSTYIAPTPTAS